jgi:hypothetical protein
MGFVQKYPQAYESRRAIDKHIKEAGSKKNAAGNFRRDGIDLDRHLAAWEKQMDRRGRHYT